MRKKMKMSIVIVAYKSGDILKKCLDSINQYNDLGNELEVIVVDNSPEDARVESVIADSSLKGVCYILANNDGFGAGNNIGARMANGEIVAFINPDIILIEPVFKSICERFDENKRLALMGVKLLYEDLTPGFSFYFDYKMSVVKKWSLKLWNKTNRFDSKQMYIAGANLFVRRNVFEKAGMFDENIFMYYEEPDLSRRIRKAFPECDIYFDPSLRMIHLEKKSTPNSLFSVKQEMDSAIYYGKKYGLDYKRKIRFEYRYYKLKQAIYKIMNSPKAVEIDSIITMIKNTYSEFV